MHWPYILCWSQHLTLPGGERTFTSAPASNNKKFLRSFFQRLWNTRRTVKLGYSTSGSWVQTWRNKTHAVIARKTTRPIWVDTKVLPWSVWGMQGGALFHRLQLFTKRQMPHLACGEANHWHNAEWINYVSVFENKTELTPSRSAVAIWCFSLHFKTTNINNLAELYMSACMVCPLGGSSSTRCQSEGMIAGFAFRRLTATRQAKSKRDQKKPHRSQHAYFPVLHLLV